MIYPYEKRIENRSEAEKIQPILARIVAQIAEKQKKLQQAEKDASDIEAQADAARSAGDYHKSFKLTQAAIEARKQAKTIKAEIKQLDEQHEHLLYRARSLSKIEYR